MARDFIEVYGTVANIGPIEPTGLQKINLINANTSTIGAAVDDRLILHVQQTITSIQFDLNTPVTARGIYVQATAPSTNPSTQSYVYGTYGNGYIRYKGRTYN